jgi:serine/threonine-protein kinase
VVVAVSPTSIPAPPTTLPPLVVIERTPLATASPVPTRRPAPRSSPTVVETVAPPPAAAPPPVSLAASPGGGFLQLLVVPWAEVSVDGRALGRLKSEKLPLGPGAHTVRLVHPDYQPLQRKVTILPGETMKLVIEMAEDAVPKK